MNSTLNTVILVALSLLFPFLSFGYTLGELYEYNSNLSYDCISVERKKEFVVIKCENFSGEDKVGYNVLTQHPVYFASDPPINSFAYNECLITNADKSELILNCGGKQEHRKFRKNKKLRLKTN